MLDEVLNRTSRDWHTRIVTLNEVKGLAVRFFAEFILSVAEGLRMTLLKGHLVKCTNVLNPDLVVHRNKDEGCHSEPEHRGGEESRFTRD